MQDNSTIGAIENILDNIPKTDYERLYIILTEVQNEVITNLLHRISTKKGFDYKNNMLQYTRNILSEIYRFIMPKKITEDIITV